MVHRRVIVADRDRGGYRGGRDRDDRGYGGRGRGDRDRGGYRD